MFGRLENVMLTHFSDSGLFPNQQWAYRIQLDFVNIGQKASIEKIPSI